MTTDHIDNKLRYIVQSNIPKKYYGIFAMVIL